MRAVDASTGSTGKSTAGDGGGDGGGTAAGGAGATGDARAGNGFGAGGFAAPVRRPFPLPVASEAEVEAEMAAAVSSDLGVAGAGAGVTGGAGSYLGGPAALGHLPLLWLLAPVALAFAVCFASDLHAPAAGAALVAAGGVAALLLHRSRRWWHWAAAMGAGAFGLGMLLFAWRVAPLPDWSGLPPREATLTLRWTRVFSPRPDARTLSGVAHVLSAPPECAQLAGAEIYCSVRKPLPAAFAAEGAVFEATGVLDTSRRELARRQAWLTSRAAKSGEPPPPPDDGFLDYLEGRRATMCLTRARFGRGVEPPPVVLRAASRQAERIGQTLRRGIEDKPETAALLAAVILGRTDGVSREQRRDFSRTGTAHLFSVSGLHVGVIAALLLWLGRRLPPVPAPVWRALVIAVLLGFVFVTGAKSAALRAWLMVACALAATLANRRGGAGAGLVLAAAAALAWEPRLWLDIGFQLSYGVVAALVFYGMPLSDWVLARWRPFGDAAPESGRAAGGAAAFWRGAAERGRRWLVGSAAISASATLASAPLIVGHFGLFSPGALLANLAVVPLAFPVIWLGFASVVLGLFGADALAAPLNTLAAWNLELVVAAVRTASALPGMAWETRFASPAVAPAAALFLQALFVALPFGAPRKAWLFAVPPVFVAAVLILGAT
ncbi:MAG: ComEC/Rec2 family competence protein [Puniceicoccales bacterium]|jgi:competence protein ComEC|nr:ComEC/Rec2 family competence protein [Puniceicoccales bacterium]